MIEDQTSACRVRYYGSGAAVGLREVVRGGTNHGVGIVVRSGSWDTNQCPPG